MRVVVTTKPAVGTRYLAERDRDKEREGTARRALFSEEQDGLTPQAANLVLSGERGAPSPVDLHHIVISPEEVMAFERLGDDTPERRDNFRDAVRELVLGLSDELQARDLKWVAGIHLNTAHPHVHLLLSKEMTDAATGATKRLEYFPRKLQLHSERAPLQGEVKDDKEIAFEAEEAGNNGQIFRQTNYGRLGFLFSEILEKRAQPVRQIAFSIDHGTELSRRELVQTGGQRSPSDEEKTVGAWVLAEAKNNGREEDGDRLIRLRLRAEVERLDQQSRARSEPLRAAYIPTEALRDAIKSDHVRVLKDDGTLAQRYHNPQPVEGISRVPLEEIRPAHGGQIYGFYTGDSKLPFFREIVSINPDPATLLDTQLTRGGDEAGKGDSSAGAILSKEEASVASKDGGRPAATWIRVTLEDPCPICHKPDNCSIVVAEKPSKFGSEVETTGAKNNVEVSVFCRRVESERPASGGWFHPLPSESEADRYVLVEKTEQNPLAPIEQRHRVFKRTNELLKPNDRDLANLRERGLSDEAIEGYGYSSVPTKFRANQVVKQLLSEGYDLKNVPGFYRPDPEKNEWRMNMSDWHKGFMVSALNVDAKIQGQQIRRAEVKALTDPATGQIKLDPVTGKEKQEARYVWLSSANKPATSLTEAVIRHDGASPGSPVHFRDVERIRASGEAILTEGVLKADVIAHYLDCGVIGVAGVGNFPKEFGQQLRQNIPQLRRVLVAYDADVVRNPHVQLHLNKLVENLAVSGLEVQIARWDESYGKGLDDVLKNELGKKFHLAGASERANKQQEFLRSLDWQRGTSQEKSVPTEKPTRRAMNALQRAAEASEDHQTLPQAEKRDSPAAIPLTPGLKDADSGREVTPAELKVARWIRHELEMPSSGKTSPELYKLREEIRTLDRDTSARRKEPLTPAVMHPDELAAAVKGGQLLSQSEMIARQKECDRSILGDELKTRLLLKNATYRYSYALEQAETGRYEVTDTSTGRKREISGHDIDQRASVRARRYVADASSEIENASPHERAEKRSSLQLGATKSDIAEHQETLEEIAQKHKIRIERLDDEVVRAHHAHDPGVIELHKVERAYRAAGQELTTPHLEQKDLNLLHEQAVSRADTEMVKFLDELRQRLGAEKSQPAYDEQSQSRLPAQARMAEDTSRVCQERAKSFEENYHNRKWEIDGQDRKYSLANVDREQARKQREVEYHTARSSFFNAKGLAAGFLKEQVGRLNPLNLLHPSAFNPLNPIINHPVVQVVRASVQLYQLPQKMAESREAARQATERLKELESIRSQVVEKVEANRAELKAKVEDASRFAETMQNISERESLGRAARGERAVKPEYKEWELRRMESNACRLKDASMLQDYEDILQGKNNSLLEKAKESLAAGHDPVRVARGMVEQRIKDAMAGLEPTRDQIRALNRLNVRDIPENRMLAAEKIEEVTGGEAVWRKVGRETVANFLADGRAITPEAMIAHFQQEQGRRAVAREIVARAQQVETTRQLESFNDFRDYLQVRYLDTEGIPRTASLKDTEPKSWIDSLKRMFSEPEGQIQKRVGVRNALGEQEARLTQSLQATEEFSESTHSVADSYRQQIGTEQGEPKPQFTSQELNELERIGGGLKQAELARMEQIALPTKEQMVQIEYSRIVQDALDSSRAANPNIDGTQSGLAQSESRPHGEDDQRDLAQDEARERADREESEIESKPETGESAPAEEIEIEEDLLELL